MLSEYWYIFIAAAILVIFFGVRVGSTVARSMAARRAAMDPLNCAELQIGQKFEMDGKLEQAVKAYTQMVERYPDCETGYLFLGYLQKKRKDFRSAAGAFRGALRVNPDSVDALVEVANAEWASGNAGEASGLYLQVLASDPDNRDAHAALGALLDEEGKSAAAIEHLERFVALAGGNPSRRHASMIVEARSRLERLKTRA